MTKHSIEDSLLDEMLFEFQNGHHWIAYNERAYQLGNGDMFFFPTKAAATEFAIDNYSDEDQFSVMYGQSPVTVATQLQAEVNLTTLKINDMKQENFDHLKDNLKYMGFGDKLYPQLELELAAKPAQFQLTLETEINAKAFAAVLNFRKSGQTDNYFFNSYHATLQRKDGDVVDQAFYLNKGKGVTAKEAFNLLDGRAVHKELTTKEGQPYQAWIQLDFDKRDKNNNHEVRQFHDAYGYNLKEAVGKFAVKEMDGGEKEKALLQSLQKGNVQSVTMEVKGELQKMFIEANPQYKTVTLYDDKMKRLGKEQQLEVGAGVARKESKEAHGVKENQQQRVEGNKKKGVKNSGDTLQQGKKASKKRGLSL